MNSDSQNALNLTFFEEIRNTRLNRYRICWVSVPCPPLVLVNLLLVAHDLVSLLLNLKTLVLEGERKIYGGRVKKEEGNA